jgi:acetyl-CoA acetyltransferase family protein
MPMAITAENLAVKYEITREDQDRFALLSQQRAKDAWLSGRMVEEVVAVPIRDKKGNPNEFVRDEHMRPDTTLEALAKLAPRFKKDGTVTAGNASGIVDGAAMTVITSRAKAEERGLKPLGRLLSWGHAGVDPDIMGIGPAPAMRQALQRADLTLDEIDLIEVNEAFAAQTLAVARELGIDLDILNVNGGAIAIGHPLAATGARLTLTILYELRRRNKRYGVASMCIGGGQGIAAVVENLN